MLHEVTVDEKWFELHKMGVLNFTVRINDRNYKAGDSIILNEIDKAYNRTGRLIVRFISYVMTDRNYVPTGEFCILALKSLLELPDCECMFEVEQYDSLLQAAIMEEAEKAGKTPSRLHAVGRNRK